MRVPILLIVAAGLISPISAQKISRPNVSLQIRSETLDRIAAAEMARQKIPGMAIAAVRDNRIVYAKGFGVASAESRVPVTPDTLFRIGSATKMLTAAAAVKLAQQGAFLMDAPVGNYITGLNPKIGGLTAQQLLSHTAGLWDEAPPYGPHDEEALARRVTTWKDSALFAEPGKTFSYSNPGYALAGRLIEVAKGARYADAMDELVLKPVGMNRSTFRPTMAMTYPVALGYATDGKLVRPVADNAGAWPAGFLFSSANDLAQFVLVFVNGGKLGDTELLPPAVIAALAKPRVRLPGSSGIEYGYGLYVDAARGVRVLAHGGTIDGYASDVMMAPDFKAGVVVLTNRDGVDAAAISQQILDRLLPVGYGPPPQPGPMASANPSAYSGEYVNGAARLSASPSEGKLQVKTPSMTGDPVTLEPIGSDCFRGKTAAICFTGDFAFWNGRAYRKQ